MVGSSAVQFYGINAITKAIENRDVEAWSVWQKNQFMFKGMGIDALKNTLLMLAESYSTATYTIKIYEDIKEEKQIKSSTPDDGSFNFKLFNVDEGGEGFKRIGYPGNAKESQENAILEKLKQIEDRLDKQDEEPEENDSLGVIGKILQHPAIAPMVPQIMEMIVGLINPKNAEKAPEQNMHLRPSNSYHTQPLQKTAFLNGIDEDKIITEAISQLKQYDQNLPAHLQKLASIAQNDNSTFQMLLSLLDK